MNQQNSNQGNSNKRVKKFCHSPICIGGLIGLVFSIIFSLFAYFNVLHDLELKTIIYRFQYFQADHKPSKDILILGIDNPEMKRVKKVYDPIFMQKYNKKFKHWPFDRLVYADLVEALTFYGVHTITFDIFFPEYNEENKETDLQFARAVLNAQEAGTEIIMGSIFENKTPEESLKYYSERDYTRLEELAISNEFKPRRISYFDVLMDIDMEKLKKINANLKDIVNFEQKQLKHKFVLLKPFPDLFEGIGSLGITNVKKSEDVEFKLPLLIEYNENLFPSLGFASYLATLKQFTINNQKKFLKVNNNKIPVIGDNYFMVNWYKPPENQQYAYQMREMSYLIDSYKFLKKASKNENMTTKELQDKFEQFFSCINDNSCSEELVRFINKFPDNAPVSLRKDYKNTHVFVGSIDKRGQLKDTGKTPINDELPGVIIHANLFDNLLQKDYVYKTPVIITIIIIFFLGISTGITVLGIKNPYLGLANGLIFWFYVFIPLVLFKFKGICADIVYAELTIILTYFSAVGYQWISSDKDKKLLKNTFSNYLSPQIMNEVLVDPTKIDLGGETEYISILFSDIRGFTSISEKYKDNPKDLVVFLNEYFDAMVDAILENEGTIDKFIGDAIMAFWGAPVKKENHAELAVRGALGMIEALDNLKRKWKEEGKEIPDINIGIGINTGDALVGHVGSTKIKSYTVIGDSVNLASRLEGLNKKYAKDIIDAKNIIISEYTYEAVKDKIDAEYLDDETVKGKLIPVKIYKVKGLKEI